MLLMSIASYVASTGLYSINVKWHISRMEAECTLLVNLCRCTREAQRLCPNRNKWIGPAATGKFIIFLIKTPIQYGLVHILHHNFLNGIVKEILVQCRKIVGIRRINQRNVGGREFWVMGILKKLGQQIQSLLSCFRSGVLLWRVTKYNIPPEIIPIRSMLVCRIWHSAIWHTVEISFS